MPHLVSTPFCLVMRDSHFGGNEATDSGNGSGSGSGNGNTF
ncbi:hypothetical protein PENDEC_c007G05738 [Penicillium decumbens]|uniref:Uncharacterized protein n=1 Tax=Penicillium decumbens TaxID=69771 RepID=A0A1V6PEH0_PENDC|nr:hypothetical protein PENDEC_c007G05738 [Penicillium decumbens]